MSSEETKDIESLAAALSALHDDIHSDDIGPQNELEAQAGVVQLAIQRTVMNLIERECSPEIIEMSLFINWHQLFVLTAGIEEEAINIPLDRSLAVAAKMIRSITNDITDDGPTEKMAELGNLVTAMKSSFQELSMTVHSHAAVEAQSQAVNTALFGVVRILLDKELHPSLIQNTLLYMWLRLSTMNANVDEAFFQKVERNWPDVIDRFNPSYMNFIEAQGFC